MPGYDVQIDIRNRNTSHVQVLELVGSGKRVLDVGCWSGSLGRALIDQGCRVSGVEIDPEAAAIAAEALEAVVVADLDQTLLTDHFPAGSFDVIVFADVLEHLKDPERVLSDAVALLSPEGRVVISLPNVAHGSLRLAHLLGRWDLSDTGLLDRTHIRFFNRDRLLDLLEGAGLVLEDLRGTTADPLGVEVQADSPDLPAHIVEWVRNQPDAFVYQFQAAARPRRGDEPVGRRVPLVEAGDSDTVRLRDRHTAAHERALRQELGAVDNTIGLEAEVATLNAAAKKLRATLSERNVELRQTKRRLASRTARVQELESSVHDLEARLAAAPMRRARRTAGRVARRLGLRH